jgi:hypothetical protein
MKITQLFILTFSALSLMACGQTSTQKKNIQTIQKNKKMDTSKLTNENVKKAFEAWQNGDSKTFLSFFAAEPKLFDDGNPRNFQSFVKEACGYEKFTSIESVSNDGKNITGNFHTASWGDFKTYFNFTVNEEGKFSRLDIGQAK